MGFLAMFRESCSLVQGCGVTGTSITWWGGLSGGWRDPANSPLKPGVPKLSSRPPEAGRVCSHPQLLSSDLLVVVQLLSCVRLCHPMDCSMPGFPVLHYIPDLAQTQVHQASDAIQPSHPLLLLLPSIFLSLRVFSNESALHLRGQSIEAPASASGLISFRIDWFDLLAVQGTLKCLLQCYNLKASVL